MTEQDAETSSGQSTADSQDDETGEAVADEPLSDIADQPDGDVDSALDEIVSGDGDEPAGEDEKQDSTGTDDDLVTKIEQSDAETVAEAIHLLRDEVVQLEDELEAVRERADDLESRLKRKQADFQNYKKRQQEQKEKEIQRATESLVERLIDVRDNLKRALDQDEDTDIRGGVETTLEQFDQELERENVSPIEPDVGGEVDPRNHEVLATITGETPEGTIAEVHRPGYEMAGKVLRPAQVAVSDGTNYEEETADDAEE